MQTTAHGISVGPPYRESRKHLRYPLDMERHPIFNVTLFHCLLAGALTNFSRAWSAPRRVEPSNGDAQLTIIRFVMVGPSMA